MKQLRAEVISIGDEITSGVRLDTNTQWISKQLGDLGIRVAFQSTVGDDLADNVDVFRVAANRADVIISTGGLGPTADDLTRQAIADMAGVELVRDQSVFDHIKDIYVSRGREMPANNENQAWFPASSKIVNNPEGTAPGIDFSAVSETGSGYRIFALPGVPVEMTQMWDETVAPELKQQTGDDFVIHHHTIHCFGAGESHVETLLPDVVQRGRDPSVGITASSATISLRISTRAKTKADCLHKMQPTIATINDCLGDLIYGENGQELHQVVVEALKAKDKTIAVYDTGLHGAVAKLISMEDFDNKVLVAGEVAMLTNGDLKDAAANLAIKKKASFGLAIGPVNRDLDAIEAGKSRYTVAIADSDGCHVKELRFSGHSQWRESRAVKEVLNFVRLHILNN